jgi:hypothetical protein
MTNIKLPTNGSRGPTDAADEDAAADAEAALDNDEDVLPASDYTVAVSPRQLAAGFAILAALLVLVVRRRKKD